MKKFSGFDISASKLDILQKVADSLEPKVVRSKDGLSFGPGCSRGQGDGCASYQGDGCASYQGNGCGVYSQGCYKGMESPSKFEPN